MHFEKRTKKDGSVFHIAIDDFIDPLTGKRKRASISFNSGTPLKKITPLMIKQSLDTYKQDYHSTFSTMQHIKSTFNKIFDYAVLYNYLQFSPSQVVKLKPSTEEKVEKKARLNQKFLNEAEIEVLISELRKRRNPSYLDLTLFLLGTGCRVGEAAALTAENIDFQRKTVTIEKSLQTHDLTVDEFYLDTTKTLAGERIEELPETSRSCFRSA